MLLGETAEVPGLKVKPAESQSEGVFQDAEIWNTYQGVQEHLSNSICKETESAYESGKEFHHFFLKTMIVICLAKMSWAFSGYPVL